jgi:hypothetical protein
MPPEAKPPVGNVAQPGDGAGDGFGAPGRRRAPGAPGPVTLLPPPPREPSAAPDPSGPPRPGAL